MPADAAATARAPDRAPETDVRRGDPRRRDCRAARYLVAHARPRAKRRRPACPAAARRLRPWRGSRSLNDELGEVDGLHGVALEHLVHARDDLFAQLLLALRRAHVVEALTAEQCEQQVTDLRKARGHLG